MYRILQHFFPFCLSLSFFFFLNCFIRIFKINQKWALMEDIKKANPLSVEVCFFFEMHLHAVSTRMHFCEARCSKFFVCVWDELLKPNINKISQKEKKTKQLSDEHTYTKSSRIYFIEWLRWACVTCEMFVCLNRKWEREWST